jgi:hypothetical protein
MGPDSASLLLQETVRSSLSGAAGVGAPPVSLERLTNQIVCGVHGLVLLVQLVLVSVFFAWTDRRYRSDEHDVLRFLAKEAEATEGGGFTRSYMFAPANAGCVAWLNGGCIDEESDYYSYHASNGYGVLNGGGGFQAKGGGGAWVWRAPA